MSDTGTPRLWEVKHPYYCSEFNWFSNDSHEDFASWAEFTDGGMFNSDPDLNLLFRWDWATRPETCPDCEGNGWADHETRTECARCGGHGDLGEEHPAHYLSLFWMLQRKGLFICTEIHVTEDDEPAVRTWLTERAKTITALWQPLALTELPAAD